MILTNLSQHDFLLRLEVKLGIDYTDEQRELIKSFGDGPVFCFADPGTGKTFTAIGGLINAELYKGIPGDNIYALSFTRLATGSLASRAEVACQKLRITRQVNFATLHKLCRDILKENCQLLDMLKFDTSAPLSMYKSFELISDTCAEWDISLDPNQIRAAIMACRSLNASLIFDPDVIETKMAFKECRMDYKTFDRIRGLLFSYSLLADKISVSDLLLYTVMLLTRHPEVSEEFKKKCKLMLVDEAQDLSLLQLRIISLLTDNPILIGDMKQQIYGFNGACQEVVQEFHRLYPGCKDLKLTQSFRCMNEIADYATKIILPNKIGGEDYKGVGNGGKVKIIEGLYEKGADIQGLCRELHSQYVKNKNNFPKDYLFLTRTNVSIIPIVEELYRQGLPFRVNKYTPAYEIPLIKELCSLIRLAEQPYNYELIHALQYLIPEFRGYKNLKEHPLYNVCVKTGCSVFEVNYQFKNPVIASKAMNLLIDVQEMLNSNRLVKDIFNTLWRMFEENWVSYIQWRLEERPGYYTDAVYALTDKDYPKFIQDEIKKQDIIVQSEKYERGVRCYTMHASKGLEADIVYIVDANEGIIPNEKKLKRMLDKGCDMDAARAVREERSLCYVACTRAREELNIVFTGNLSPMLLGINKYEQLDSLYGYYKSTGDDITAFEEFTERYVHE